MGPFVRNSTLLSHQSSLRTTTSASINGFLGEKARFQGYFGERRMSGAAGERLCAECSFLRCCPLIGRIDRRDQRFGRAPAVARAKTERRRAPARGALATILRPAPVDQPRAARKSGSTAKASATPSRCMMTTLSASLKFNGLRDERTRSRACSRSFESAT